MTRDVWRIVKAKHADAAYSGEGARRFGGRWNSPGLSVVYMAESRSLAAMEMLVHLNSQSLLGKYVIGRAVIQEKWIESVRSDSLPTNWREFPASYELRAIGDRWLHAGKAAVLKVPSAVVEGEFNFLLNPTHVDFHKIKIEEFQRFVFDKRLK